MNVLSEKDAAYIAGFLDADGCICLHTIHNKTISHPGRKPTYTLRVHIVNTFPGVIEWICMKVGTGCIWIKKPAILRHKQIYTWRINGEKAINFLRQIYPYMKVKRLQAEIAFEFGETLSLPGRHELTEKVISIRDELKKRLSSLNGYSIKKAKEENYGTTNSTSRSRANS